MFTTHTEPQSFQIGQEQFFAFVQEMIGGGRGREDDDHPLPPGPWDPVVRSALDRTSVLYGPHTHASNSFGDTVALNPQPLPPRHAFLFGDTVALNPQPLPPRYRFLVAVTQSVVSRAELLQEVAAATSREGDRQGIIIVGGYTTRFSDDWCGTGFKLRYPFPGPRPHWFSRELSGLDLLVLAAQFNQAAKETFSRDVQHSLADASAKFLQAGMARIQ